MTINYLSLRVQLSAVYSIAVFIFCLSSFYFYEPFFLNEAVLKVFYWVMLAAIFGFSFRFILYTSGSFLFASSTRLLLLSMLISTLPALFFWGQSPVLTFRAMFPLLGFVLYFFLVATKPTFKTLLSIIWVLAILYVAIYIFSLLQAPNSVFGSFQDKDIGDQRGIFRLFIPGRGFLFLAFFIAVSNYLSSRKNYWLLIAFGFFAIILAHVIRQYILFSVLIAGWVLFWNVPFWKKIGFLIVSVVFGYYIYQNSTIVQSLIFLTETQAEASQEESVRVIAYRYFFNDFGQNFITHVLGNGVPHDQSDYGRFYRLVVNEQMRLFLSDVGFAQVYAQFGILGFISVLYIFYRSFFAKISRQHLFLKLFMVFVFFSNILSGYFLSYHNIAAISIVMYMYEISNNENE